MALPIRGFLNVSRLVSKRRISSEVVVPISGYSIVERVKFVACCYGNYDSYCLTRNSVADAHMYFVSTMLNTHSKQTAFLSTLIHSLGHLLGKDRVCQLFKVLDIIWQRLDKLGNNVANV